MGNTFLKWFVASVVLVVAAFQLSPWPSIWIIRAIFDHGASVASGKLEKHVPLDVEMVGNLKYDSDDPDAGFDIIRPKAPNPGKPTIVWIHGGGFVSGKRSDLTNYLKVLAGKGFTVVNLDYTIAPEATYPTPVRQVNKALAYLTANGEKLGINANKLVLAGDSAGAQIAAQTAAIIASPDYAALVGITPGAARSQVRGALLYCGVYDVTKMGKGGGIISWFVSSTTWAYSGKRDWHDVPGFDTMSVASHVSRSFPPAFISAGNADPLGPQSVALSKALIAKGVAVDSLFFPDDHQPALGHEYQFDLDGDDGQLALQRSVDWLKSLN